MTHRCGTAGAGSSGSAGAKPVANTTAPGWNSPCDVRTSVTRPPHGAGASRERRRQPQGVHPPLLANAQGAGNVAQLRLDRVGALRIQDVDECAELGVERQCLRQRDEPFERLDADRAVPLGIEGAQ